MLPTSNVSSIHSGYHVIPGTRAGAFTGLPKVAYLALNIIKKIHESWRWVRRLRFISRKPSNIVTLGAGYLVQILGRNPFVQIPANAFLITHRVLETIESLNKIHAASTRLRECIRGYYLPSVKIEVNDNSSRFFSPSTIYWLKLKFHQLLIKTHRVFLCTWNVLKNLFKISMNTLDIVEIFTWSEEASREAVNEMFQNMQQCFEKIIENKDELLEGMENFKHLFERLMGKKNPLVSPQKIFEKVKDGISGTENFMSHLAEEKDREGNPKSEGEHALSYLAKQAIWGHAFLLGLDEHVPDKFVPSPSSSLFPPPKKESPRFPDIPPILKK